MSLAICNVLARTTNGAKGERRVTAPTPRNGGGVSGGDSRDEFPVSGDGGDALGDCLSPPYSWPSCELGEERSLAG